MLFERSTRWQIYLHRNKSVNVSVVCKKQSVPISMYKVKLARGEKLTHDVMNLMSAQHTRLYGAVRQLSDSQNYHRLEKLLFHP